MSLKVRAVSGVKWTTTATAITTVLQLLKLAVLARYLEPADFGLMAVVMVVIGFAQAFMDMGISKAIIHRQDISHSQLSSLYWLNIISGVAVAAAVAGIAPLVAAFYEDDRLTRLTVILASVFVVGALGNQYRILCQKEMEFSTIAKITTSAELMATGAAIVLAISGYGVYALVYSLLIGTFLNSLGFLYVGLRRHHRPLFTFKYTELGGFFSFGLFQMGDRAVNYGTAQLDKILIGRIVGMEAVGFYNLAWQLVLFPVSKINPIANLVAFPAYAKVQSNFELLNRYYAVTVKLLSLVTIPLLAFLFFFAEDLVLLVFGPGWQRTAFLVQILALVGVGRAVGNPGGALVLALGRADVGFWWNSVWALVMVISLFVSLSLWPSAETAAYTLLILYGSIGMYWHVIVARIGQVHYGPIVRHFLRVGLLAVLIALVAKHTPLYLSGGTLLVRLLFALSVCTVLYGIYLYLFERKLLAQVRV